MQALRTRAACVARRTRPTTLRTARTYASESHGANHGHAALQAAEEGLGTAFFVFAGAIPASMFAYSVSRPGDDGQPSSLSKWLAQFDYFNDWETRNALRTEIIEQAAHDKHLFLNSGKSMHVELKTPELFNSGSPWNVPAGHYARLDHVTEHYRKQAADEEERKAKRMLAKKEAAEQQQQK